MKHFTKYARHYDEVPNGSRLISSDDSGALWEIREGYAWDGEHWLKYSLPADEVQRLIERVERLTAENINLSLRLAGK